MWAGDAKYDVGGKGFDPTVGKITAQGGWKSRAALEGIARHATRALLLER